MSRILSGDLILEGNRYGVCIKRFDNPARMEGQVNGFTFKWIYPKYRVAQVPVLQEEKKFASETRVDEIRGMVSTITKVICLFLKKNGYTKESFLGLEKTIILGLCEGKEYKFTSFEKAILTMSALGKPYQTKVIYENSDKPNVGEFTKEVQNNITPEVLMYVQQIKELVTKIEGAASNSSSSISKQNVSLTDYVPPTEVPQEESKVRSLTDYVPPSSEDTHYEEESYVDNDNTQNTEEYTEDYVDEYTEEEDIEEYVEEEAQPISSSSDAKVRSVEETKEVTTPQPDKKEEKLTKREQALAVQKKKMKNMRSNGRLKL